MRIVSGKHKGRKIELGKQAAHVRPTSGFMREAVYNILTHGVYAQPENSPFIGKYVADIFCGSGAFGLEALSRGAAHVTFVDMDHHTLLGAKANAERLGELENVSFLRANAAQLPPSKHIHSMVFLDPPYFSNLISPCLASLLAGRWVDADSLIIIEHDQREQPAIPAALEEIDMRRYGRAFVRLLTMKRPEA